jgi:ABC-2 type transport system permease protein
MEYRADFLISFIGMVFFNITGFLFLWVLFKTVQSIEGWDYYRLIFMYGFMLLSLCPYQLFFENMHKLHDHLISGSFIKYYYKPLNMMFYYFSEIFDLKGLGQIVLGIIIFVFAASHLTISWPFTRVLLLIFLILSSSLTMISLMLIASFSGFWFLNAFPLMEFVYKLKDFARFPLTIFNNFFYYVFTYLIPIGFISYYPVKYFLSDDIIPFYILLTPLLVGSILFTLAVIMWRAGIAHYGGTGS